MVQALGKEAQSWDWFDMNVESAGSIAWTRSNLVLSADSTRPLVHAQLIPASPESRPTHRFDITPPPIVATSSAYYRPPSCIAVSPEEKCIFAFFPPSAISIDGGISCVWERGNDITVWRVKEFWKSERGNDVVTSRWLGEESKWCGEFSEAHGPSLRRLSSSGPSTLNTPTLLLVMQMNEVQLHVHTPFLQQSASFFNHMRAPLRHPVQIFEVDRQNAPHLGDGPGGQRVCLRAAIGLSEDESSILIATQSVIVPSVLSSDSASFGMGFPQNASFSDIQRAWEDWGEQYSLEVCEVQVDLLSTQRSLITKPLFAVPIPSTPEGASSSTTSLPQNFQGLTSLTMHISPTTRPIASESPLGGCVLLASAVDSRSRSYIQSWRITRSFVPKIEPPDDSGNALTSSQDDSSESDLGESPWIIVPGPRHTFGPGSVVVDVQGTADRGAVLICTIGGNDRSLETTSEEKKVHESPPTGAIKRFDILTLQESLGFTHTFIYPRRKNKYDNVPTLFVVSPNHMFVAAWCGFYPPHLVSVLPAPSYEAPRQLENISLALASCLMNAGDPTDIIRAFWLRFKVTDVLPLVSGALKLLSGHTSTSLGADPLSTDTPSWLPPVSGFLVGLYKNSPRGELHDRWQMNFALCELLACERAFDECFTTGESGPRPHEIVALWQLIAMSGWVFARCETLFRDALRFRATRRWMIEEEDQGRSDIAHGYLPFILLPYTISLFRRLLEYALHVRGVFQAMTVKSQPVVIAKDQLRSALEESPLLVDQVLPLFRQLEEDASRTLREDVNLQKAAYESLIGVVPPRSLSELLDSQTTLIYNHPALQNDDAKTRLLVPLEELLDVPEVVRRHTDGSETDKDILTKTLLHGTPALGLRVCTRCGSKSELRWLDRRTRVAGRNGTKWMNYENEWENNCVCGGSWVIEKR